MAKAWISDRWLKKTTITLDDGSTIQSEATAAAKRSLAANTAHPQRANVPQQYRTAEYGHGSRWAVFWRADGKRKRRNFSDYHEAEAFAAGLEDDIRSCRYIDPDDELRVFSEAAELWVAGLHGTVKESSEARYRRELRIWVLPRWADIPVGRITTGAIQRWVAQLVEGKAPRNGKTGTAGPLADRYIRTIVKIVTKNVLDLAVSEGWILKNPMDGVKLPKAKASTKRVYLVPQEIKCIADEMSRDDATGVFLLAYTGIRIGELLALRCGDVDFERKRLTISKPYPSMSKACRLKHCRRGTARGRFLFQGTSFIVCTCSPRSTAIPIIWFVPRAAAATRSRTGATASGHPPCNRPAWTRSRGWCLTRCAIPTLRRPSRRERTSRRCRA